MVRAQQVGETVGVWGVCVGGGGVLCVGFCVDAGFGAETEEVRRLVDGGEYPFYMQVHTYPLDSTLQSVFHPLRFVTSIDNQFRFVARSRALHKTPPITHPSPLHSRLLRLPGPYAVLCRRSISPFLNDPLTLVTFHDLDFGSGDCADRGAAELFRELCPWWDDEFGKSGDESRIIGL